MLDKLHAPPDLLALGPARRTLPQVHLGLLRPWLRELAVEMRRKLPRNMPCKHLILCAGHALQSLRENLMPPAQPGSHRPHGTVQSLSHLFIGKLIEIPQ